MALRTGQAGPCYGRENITVSRMPMRKRYRSTGQKSKSAKMAC